MANPCGQCWLESKMEKHCQENAICGVNHEDLPSHLTVTCGSAQLFLLWMSSQIWKQHPPSTVSQSQKSESAQWSEKRLGRTGPTYTVLEWHHKHNQTAEESAEECWDRGICEMLPKCYLYRKVPRCFSLPLLECSKNSHPGCYFSLSSSLCCFLK